jgi:hypothetical protein
MLNVSRAPEQTVVAVEVIVPGLGRELTTVTGRLLEFDPHPFAAVTVTLPFALLVVAVTDKPPAPVLVTFQPVGTDHIYEVAPVTAVIL